MHDDMMAHFLAPTRRPTGAPTAPLQIRVMYDNQSIELNDDDWTATRQQSMITNGGDNGSAHAAI
eukprot:scaffold160282_cov20-Prasinocladus_malaysianus.AAC.1